MQTSAAASRVLDLNPLARCRAEGQSHDRLVFRHVAALLCIRQQHVALDSSRPRRRCESGRECAPRKPPSRFHAPLRMMDRASGRRGATSPRVSPESDRGCDRCRAARPLHRFPPQLRLSRALLGPLRYVRSKRQGGLPSVSSHLDCEPDHGKVKQGAEGLRTSPNREVPIRAGQLPDSPKVDSGRS